VAHIDLEPSEHEIRSYFFGQCSALAASDATPELVETLSMGCAKVGIGQLKDQKGVSKAAG
jgi:hypothetical protein